MRNYMLKLCKALTVFLLALLFSCFNLISSNPIEPAIKPPSGSKALDIEIVNEIISLNGLNLSADSIADTYNERITILWLGRLGIDSLPPSMSKLGALEILLLDGNMISSLPSEIGKMERLEYISLSKNTIQLFPICLLTIDSLKRLDLSHNYLTTIPQEAMSRYYVYDYSFCAGPCGGSDCCSVRKQNGLNVNYNYLCDIDATLSNWIDYHYNKETQYYQLEQWAITQNCE